MRSVVLIVLLASACTQAAKVDKPATFERLSADPVVHGERLAKVLGCTGCHGKDLGGRDWSDDLGTLWTANLTRSAQKWSAQEFKQALISGQEPRGRDLWDMPSFLFTQLSAEELDAITAYVRSMPTTGAVHPLPTFGEVLRAKQREGVYKSSAAEVRAKGATMAPAAPGHDLARHITRATCAECHGIDLRGKTNPIDGKSTPDVRPLAASYSLEDFETFLTTGKAAGGRELPLMSDVARNRFANLTRTERAAIHAYLQALAEQP